MDGDSCLEVWDALASRRLGYETDFEFSVGLGLGDSDLDPISAGMMLSADELFFNGTLLPLHHSPRLRIIQSHMNNFQGPTLADRPSPETFPQPSSPSPCQCSRIPPAGACFAPPSPETPRCSNSLRDLFRANKSQAMAMGESSGRSIPSSKLWKHLLRGLLEKKPTESVKSTPCSNVPTAEDSPPLRSFSSSISRSTSLPEAYPTLPTLAENKPVGDAWSLDLKSVENLLSTGKSSEKSSDDSNMFPARKKKTWSSRSVSMPGSRWGSPERESSRACSREKAPSGSSGRQNSGKILMKNLERCSTNQKPPLRYQEPGNVMRQRESWRGGGEKVSSYSSNVRVTPVLSVPVSLPPSGRSNKLSKGRFSSFKDLFLTKRENTPSQDSQK